jgi:hypothetical protein
MPQGKHLAVALYGQADLAGGDASGKVAEQLGQEVGDDGRREARRVGVDEEEERVVGEDRPAFLKERPEMVLEAPELSRAAAPVGGRIHDDGVVRAAALHLAPHELEAVVGDVAYRPVRKAAQDRVLLAPLDHPLGGVDMADRGPRGRCGAGRRACVAEEVEDVHLAPGPLDGRVDPVPVDRLLGEEPRVLERRRAYLEDEAKGVIADLPVLGKVALELPASAARLAAVVEPVPVVPARAGFRVLPGPQHLGVRANERIGSPALLLHSLAAVHQLVVAPPVGDEQRRSLNGNGHRVGLGPRQSSASAHVKTRATPGKSRRKFSELGV